MAAPNDQEDFAHGYFVEAAIFEPGCRKARVMFQDEFFALAGCRRCEAARRQPILHADGDGFIRRTPTGEKVVLDIRELCGNRSKMAASTK